MNAPPHDAGAGAGIYRSRELYAFIPVPFACFGLGVWGYLATDPASSCHAVSIGQAAFRTLLLVAHGGAACLPAGIALPVPLLIAQFVLPLLLALGTVLAAVRLVIANLRHDAQVALIRTMRGHTVICGLGDSGLEAVRQLVVKQANAVAVSLDAHAKGARACERLGVPLITGDATLARTLAATGLAHARAVVICTGSDSLNLEICLAINAMTRPAGRALLMFPEVRGSWIFETITNRDIPLTAPGLQLHPFRASEVIARRLLRGDAFVPLAASPGILFIGFGDLATAILRRMVLSTYAAPGIRVRARGFDAHGEPGDEGAMPEWRRLLDATVTPHEFGRDHADAVLLRQAIATARPNVVIVTLPDDDLALRVAVLMREILDAAGYFETAMFVRVRRQTLLGGMLREMTALPLCLHRLAPFGSLGDVVAPDALFDETLDATARALHEVYLANSEGSSPARLGWERLAERYRRSSRAAADHIAVKLALIGGGMAPAAPSGGAGAAISAADIETMAQAEHYRWSLGLRAAGWRWGTARSDAMKTHPLLVPWGSLTVAAQAYNRAQVASIPDILARGGLAWRRYVVVMGAARPAPAPGVTPVVEIDLGADADADTDWRGAEAWIKPAGGAVVLRRGPGLNADLLRNFARDYPNLTKAATGWREPTAPPGDAAHETDC